MAALVGIGAVVMSLLGRPDDITTTGITTTVVMVVAAMSPIHAWHQPRLRMIDTIVGSAVGVLGGIIYRQLRPEVELEPLLAVRPLDGEGTSGRFWLKLVTAGRVKYDSRRG
jgi:uncharacterized membrane protein YccC